MADDKEKRCVIVMRRSTLTPMTTATGSIPGVCDKCSEPVMLAPSSQAMLKDYPETWIFCEFCIPDIMQKEIEAGEEISVDYAGNHYPGLEPELPEDIRRIASDPEMAKRLFRHMYGYPKA